jgi:3-oxochol-4-en-24-oyl-CoA dehydrogenase
VFDVGLVAQSARLAGIASACLAKTVDYVKARSQFGKPLGSFQAIQHRCVDLHIETQLADATWRHALRRYLLEPAMAQSSCTASAAKARCAGVALAVTKAAIQMHGAIGFTEEGGLGRYIRAALYDSAWLGGPLLHRRRFTANPAGFNAYA